MAAVAPGSYLVISHATGEDIGADAAGQVRELYAQADRAGRVPLPRGGRPVLRGPGAGPAGHRRCRRLARRRIAGRARPGDRPWRRREKAVSSPAAVPHAAARPAVSCTRREGRAIARRTGPGPSIPGWDLAVHVPHSRCVHVSGGTLGGSRGCGQLRVNARRWPRPASRTGRRGAWRGRSGPAWCRRWRRVSSPGRDGARPGGRAGSRGRGGAGPGQAAGGVRTGRGRAVRPSSRRIWPSRCGSRATVEPAGLGGRARAGPRCCPATGRPPRSWAWMTAAMPRR